MGNKGSNATNIPLKEKILELISKNIMLIREIKKVRAAISGMITNRLPL
ncbi:MAG: hypothetical protein GF311_07345 [Candidatus Lokiarchaeota archaeon]|nr:hypothetical protein [Candidatus Lokiarchaeota archaeon]